MKEGFLRTTTRRCFDFNWCRRPDSTGLVPSTGDCLTSSESVIGYGGPVVGPAFTRQRLVSELVKKPKTECGMLVPDFA
jgi:hypothetical protein